MSWSTKLFETALDRHGHLAKRLPGPPPSLPFGNASAFLGGVNPWEPVARWLAEYGPMVLVWLPTPAILLSDPQLMREVFETRRDDFYKDSPREALLPIVSDTSAFIANGEAWKERRERHPFSMPRMAPWLDEQIAASSMVFADAASRFGSRVDFRAVTERIVFDAFATMLVGETLGDGAYADFRAISDEAQHRLNALIPELPALSPRFHLARSRWRDLFSGFVAGGRVRLPQSPLSPEELAMEVGNVFPAGVFSVTSTLMSTLWLLVRHSSELERVRGALGELGTSPSWSALWGCDPLRHAILEAMRLYPGAPLYTRNTAKDRTVELGGVALPPDTPIYVTATAIHRDPRWWGEDVDAFRPSRWQKLEEARPLGSELYLPFGRGPRECLGKAFALTTLLAATATMLRWTWDFADEEHRMGWYFAVQVHEGIVASAVAGT